MKHDEIQDLVDRGIRELNEALAGGQSNQLKLFLETMARFPNYSFNNCMLIALQFPEATLIQGFHAWRKMGRTVIKGQKGIGIIAPMVYKAKDDDAKSPDESDKSKRAVRGFKVVHVFDVSQTEGKDLPEFAKVTGDPGANIAVVEQLIRDDGIELRYESIPGGANGLSQKGTILIAPDLEPAKILMTLVHEYAHEKLHADPERRKATTKTIRETEAEAVANVVCQALGVDCLEHSSDYIQLYRGDQDVLFKSLDHIQKTAAAILKAIGKHSSQNDAERKEAAV